MQQTTLQSGSPLRGSKFTYTIQSVLGQGSFGITYLATTRVMLKGDLGNVETDVKVAIKEFFMKDFCSRHADGTVTQLSEDTLLSGYARKFRKEAENLSRLSHPSIVKVLEVFEANNTFYYSMEYIAGSTLDAYVMSRGSLSEQEAIGCIRQIADALDYMHANKMLHLDLKPLNIMRSDVGGKLYLIDFGLSKHYTKNGQPESSTTIGLGTPGYAPLEQAEQRDDREDFRTTLDVYALGGTLYKMLTGQRPPTANEVNSAVLDGDNLILSELKQTGVSAPMAKVVSTAMWPLAKRRYQTVAELMKALDRTMKSLQPEAKAEDSSSVPEMKALDRTMKSLQPEAKAEDSSSVPELKILNEKSRTRPKPVSMEPTFIPTTLSPFAPATGKENGHEYVDLGLSVKWATMNVGATKPEDYGSYFAWGETKPKDTYNKDTYKWCNGSIETLTKYCTDSYYGKVDGKKALDLSDDAARANWGGSWRMPTTDEIKELEDNCTGTWTIQNGVEGCKVTSKINGKSIFLPAAGSRWYGDLRGAGSGGDYWSSSLYPSGADYFYFDSGHWGWAWDIDYRLYGLSVRAVCP